MSLDELRRAADGGRPRVPDAGHHVHRLRRRAGHRAHLPLRSAAADHHRARNGTRSSAGSTQRLTAINLFLKDIYHEGRILAEGVVPRELVYSCRHYRREMRGVRVHRDIYVSVAGTDLVRLEDGRFVVLEDNLRVPSGVSYMLANREVTKRVFPGCSTATTSGRSRTTARRCSPRCGRSRRQRPRRPDHRRADARRRQLRLLRARVPRPRDGHSARRRPRPARARHDRLHAHDVRPAARRRHLPARGRRLPRSAGVPRRFAPRRGRAAQRLSRRPRVARQRDRHRRRRRQGGLRVRAGDHPVLPRRRSRSCSNVETYLLEQRVGSQVRARATSTASS